MALIRVAGMTLRLRSATRLALQLLLMLLYITDTWHVDAQSAQLAIQNPSSARRTRSDATSGVAMFTFHGPVRSGLEAKQAEILLHVLLKTKRKEDGTFVVRTVSYTERVEPQEGERFAPIPNQLTVALEHSNKEGRWIPTYLELLGMLQGEGPFIHEKTISAQHAAREMRLRVLDWAIYYEVHLPTFAQSNSNGPNLVNSGPFRHAVVLGDMRTSNATAGAEVVATHMAHHMGLGFDMYMLYVRGSALSNAVKSNPLTAKYIMQKKLQIVSLDDLQVPLYDDANSAYDPTKLVAYNHATLSLWGEHYRLAVLDSDEMWSARDPSTTVNTWFDQCFPGADVISVSRVEVACRDCIAQGISELEFFQQHWDASAPTEVLQNFTKITNFHRDPKSIFHPDKVGQVWLHIPFTLANCKSVSVQVTPEGFDSSKDCVFVVHFINLFGLRVNHIASSDDRHHWVDSKHRRRSRVYTDLTVGTI